MVFVGVDIFYVISGYLITSLINQEIELEKFSVISFYERRIRRIFPALFAVLGFCALAACTLFSPKDLLVFGKSVIATTLFVSNVFFKHQAGRGGYFDSTSDLQVLLHTWSLSIEEQFYLLFPATLLLLKRIAKKERLNAVLSVITLGSFLISAWATQHRPLTAFYILVPRAWELLVGALLAIRAVPPLRRQASREITGFVGLGLIGVAVFFFSKDTLFPGLAALLPCLGAWLIIYSGETGPSWMKSLLSVRPLVFVGLISYSLYLWHWPILVFSRYFSAGELSSSETTIAVFLSLAMAVVSFECIEKPFRGKSTVNRRGIFALGIVSSAISLAIGFVMYSEHGLPGRYDDGTRQLIAENAERKDNFIEECGNWRKEIRNVSDIEFRHMEPTSPGPNPKVIMFWGDSHVQQLYPLIKKLHDRGELQEYEALLAVSNGCPPTEHLNRIEKGFYCDSFAKFALLRAEQDDVSTVFIGFNTWFATHQDICPSVDGKCTAILPLEETRQLFLDELFRHIKSLKSRGKRVIVSLPFPMFDKSIPDLEIRNAVFSRFGLGGVAKDITLPSFRGQVASAARRAGAEIFDPRESLCHNQECITQVDGISIYKDDNHIAAGQIDILENNFKAVLLQSH